MQIVRKKDPGCCCNYKPTGFVKVKLLIHTESACGNLAFYRFLLESTFA